MEIENNRKIAFLDTSVYKKPDGRLTTTGNQHIPINIYDQSVKRGIVKCPYDRAKRLVTKPSVIAGEKFEASIICAFF